MTRPGRPRLSPSTDPGPLYIDASDWKNPVDFSELFGNEHPVELEIGCGRGLFLAREGSSRPAVNLVGLEVAKKIAQLAAFRCLTAGAMNVRVLVIDARKFLQLIPEQSLSAVHIYFPDPWWKRRHRKRRMVAPDVLTELQRVLEPNARVHLATDVEEYFHDMRKTFAGFPTFALGPEPTAPAGDHQLDYLTHFERKFRAAGKWIGRLCYKLTGPTPVLGNNSAEEEK
jgi:tRNA (guanine-N7-)-methyltransferase